MGEEEDRAAILRRRQRLIALALGGLSGVAACDEPAASRPAPPAEVVEVTAEVGEAMTPVLEEPPPPADGILATRAVPADVESASDAAEVRHAERLKERITAPPRVCLSVMPMPCLSPAFKGGPDEE